jgi:hypothetical protein
MHFTRFFIILGLIFTLLWGVSELKKAKIRLQYEVYNELVLVEVVDLPLCGASYVITVGYGGKKYNISVNPNDCIRGRYKIGDTLEATYNPKLDEMNPGNFVGTYKLKRDFVVLLGLGFVIYLFYPSFHSLSKRSRKRRKHKTGAHFRRKS